MNNNEFNKEIKEAFKIYLKTGSRSNKKLAIIHGAIAKDLSERLSSDFNVKSLGLGDGKECKINGRYMAKKVDISVFKGQNALAGIAVKFIMSNYAQNSNNYFENMLGETANIRADKKAYFQIVIISKHVPYFKKDGTIKKIEKLNKNALIKYLKLSEDDVSLYIHSPNKTLIYIVDSPCFENNFNNKEQFKEFFLNTDFDVNICEDIYDFNETVIYNDYESFINKVVNYIKFIS